MGSIYKRGKTYWIKYYRSGKPYWESTLKSQMDTITGTIHNFGIKKGLAKMANPLI